MNEVAAALLPLAVGVAIGPVPVGATILMLLTPNADKTSGGFLAAWIAGIAVLTTAFAVVPRAVGLGDGGPTVGAAWLKTGAGLVLLALAAWQWRKRPASGTVAQVPRWLTAVDEFSVGRAAGLGLVLAVANPKNLVMCAAAGATISAAALDSGGQAAAAAGFTAIAVSTVAAPVVGYRVVGRQLREPLDRLHRWLWQNNAVVMAALLSTVGLVLVAKGLGAL